MTGTPCDLYLRLSDLRNEEALDGRVAKLRAEAGRLGWTVRRVVIENDMVPANGNGTMKPASAWKRKRVTTPSGKVELRTIRPGFRSVLADVMNGVNLLAEDLDRMVRQPRDGEDLLDAVELSGTSARSLTGSLTLTAGGTDAERMTARIMAAVASKSSADTARRVADARERLAGQSYGGGRRPYGFRPDPDAPKYHKKLIVVDAEAAVICQAAADILDRGISLKAAAAGLRARGVPTVTGAAWTASTLRDVLSKRALAGLTDPDGHVVWEPILEPDRWQRLTDLFASRKNPGTANEPRWLVSCYAACGVCGGPVRCTGANGRRAYTCTEHGHVRRNAAAVDSYVSAYVTERLSLPDMADLLRPPPRPGTDTAKLRAEARKLRDRKRSQMRMHAAGAIDDDDLAAGMKDIRDRLARVEAQLAASDAPDPLAEFRDRPAAAVWESLSLPRRRAVVRLLATVTILPATRKGAGFDPDSVRITPRDGS